MTTPPCDQQDIQIIARDYQELFADFLLDAEGINLASKTDRDMIIDYAEDLAGYMRDMNNYEDTAIAETLGVTND